MIYTFCIGTSKELTSLTGCLKALEKRVNLVESTLHHLCQVQQQQQVAANGEGSFATDTFAQPTTSSAGDSAAEENIKYLERLNVSQVCAFRLLFLLYIALTLLSDIVQSSIMKYSNIIIIVFPFL